MHKPIEARKLLEGDSVVLSRLGAGIVDYIRPTARNEIKVALRFGRGAPEDQAQSIGTLGALEEVMIEVDDDSSS